MADTTRLVDIRSSNVGSAAGEPERVGTGTLLSPRLVLTARHVVFDDHGRPGRIRLQIFGSPGFVEAEVVWPRAVEPARALELDLALLRLTDAADGADVRPLRLGRFTGRAPSQSVVVTGFPRMMIGRGVRDTFQIDGRVNPQAGLKLRRHLISVDTPPATVSPADPSPWSGISGAGVFSGEVLVGVVVMDADGFDRSVLTAVRTADLVADPRARELVAGCGPLVSAELHQLFNRPAPRPGRLSPAQLVQADKRVIPFVGRDGELADLMNWCEREDRFAANLVTGPGGRGKTRLAEKLMDQLIEPDSEWIVGNLISNSPAASNVDVRSVVETAAGRSVLIMIDYAESRVPQLEQLLSAVHNADDVPRIRLLMLARARGEWWRRLADDYPDELGETEYLSLPPLHGPPEREGAFRESVLRFAERLSELDADAGWLERAAAVQPPDLNHFQFGEPLSLQLIALVSLLATVEDPGKNQDLEDKFIAHERRYWRRSLDSAGIQVEPHLYEQAVAAATLIAARDRDAARAVLAALPELEAPGPLASWLRSLYPPDTDTRYWGPLQPDRIGEHHVGRVAKEDPQLLARLFADRDGQELEEALVVIGRALPHQPHLEGQLREIVRRRPEPVGTAIRRAAERVSNPLPLQRALRTTEDLWQDDWGAESVRSTTTSSHSSPYQERVGGMMGGAGFFGGEPAFGGSGYLDVEAEVTVSPGTADPVPFTRSGDVAALGAEQALAYGGELEQSGLAFALAGRLVEAERDLRRAAEIYRDRHAESPVLARVLITLASVLSDLRQSEGASSAADEAVFLIRAARAGGQVDADTLGRALDIQAGILADRGSIERALSCANEAVKLLHASAGVHSGLARALGTRAALLFQAGRPEDAREASLESIALYREQIGRGTETPELMRLYGRALIGFGAVTASVGALDEAEAVTREALTALLRFRDEAALPDRAAATANLAVYLARGGRAQEASDCGASAVEHYRILADSNPAFEVDLVRTLTGYATQAAQAGDRDIAAAVAAEAMDRWRQLSQGAPGRYDSDLRRAHSALAPLL